MRVASGHAAACGVRRAVCGVRCAACGVRCAVCVCGPRLAAAAMGVAMGQSEAAWAGAGLCPSRAEAVEGTGRDGAGVSDGGGPG